jgi:hypothetical protein
MSGNAKVKKNGAKGRLRGKNCSSTLVLSAVTTMGKYNVMVFGGAHSQFGSCYPWQAQNMDKRGSKCVWASSTFFEKKMD